MQKLKIDEAPAIARSTGSLTVTFTPAAISLRVVPALGRTFPAAGRGLDGAHQGHRPGRDDEGSGVHQDGEGCPEGAHQEAADRGSEYLGERLGALHPSALATEAAPDHFLRGGS